MSWNTETQQVVKDCEHTGNCPCCPEECDICYGAGMVLLVKHRPVALLKGQDGKPNYAASPAAEPYLGIRLGYLIGSDEGEEMTCPECHGEGSLS